MVSVSKSLCENKTDVESFRDQDLNVDLNAYDSTSITVISDKDGEGAEYPLLVETSASSGIFTGMLSTYRSASLGLASTGSLNMIEGFMYPQCFGVSCFSNKHLLIITVDRKYAARNIQGHLSPEWSKCSNMWS
jgi:hypothetical protein